MKLLIIGSARHGKDTVAEMISAKMGVRFMSSSMAAIDTFLFDVLNEKYGLNYKTREAAFLDRVNHRKKWYYEIANYNKYDKTRLMKKILSLSDIYVGLRSKKEIESAVSQGIFDSIIGVVDYRKPIEKKESNSIDISMFSDIIITNNGSKEELKKKVDAVCHFLKYYKK